MTSSLQSPHVGNAGNGAPTVMIAIVNYCTAGLTIDCLRALESELSGHPGAQVIVADNASPDGSGAVIAAAIEENDWSSWARLLPLPKNGGFAYGNNAAIRDYECRNGAADYVWLLNSDTVVRPGALTALLDFMAQRPRVGIAGSCLEDPDGTQQCSTFRFHTIASEFEGSLRLGPVTRLLQKYAVAPSPNRQKQRYDWVSGASMLIRGEVLERIGLLDEGYFLYFEETDFCHRACRAGWECWFVPESRVVHLVGASSGVTDRSNRVRRRASYWFESRRRYFEKQHGRFATIMADAALAAGTLGRQVISTLRRQPAEVPERFLSDLARHCAIWPRPVQHSEGQ